MWKDHHKRLKTRVLSVLAASAVAGGQLFAAIPYNAAAAGTPITGAAYTADAEEEPELWTDETSFPTSGCYKLGCDITDMFVSVSESLDIDLNGHTVEVESITCFGNVIIRDTSSWKKGSINGTGTDTLFSVYGELELYGGTINGYSRGSIDGTVSLYGEGSFKMYGGTVTADYCQALSLGRSSGTTLLAGGTLKSVNKDDSVSPYHCSAINTNDGYTGTLNITGTSISSELGDAIRSNSNDGSITISGGRINSASGYGVNCTGDIPLNLEGRIDISGKKGGIYLPKGKKVNLTGSISSVNVNVYAEGSGVITEGFGDLGYGSYVVPYLRNAGVNGTISLDESGELRFDVDGTATETTSTTTTTTATTTTATTTTATTTTTTTTTAETTTSTTAAAERYAVIKDNVTWDEAEAYCKSVNGHLAVITSPDEQAQIKELISESGATRIWLGGKRDEDEVFSWITGETFTYTNWNPGEPNNLDRIENCILVYYNGRWNDESGDHTAWFICEWENDADIPDYLPEVTTTTTATTTTTTTPTPTTPTTTTTTTTTAATTVTTTNTDPVPPAPHKLDIDGEMTVKEMNIDEIRAAGIDLGDAANYHVFKYEIKMTFDAEPVIINKYEAKSSSSGSSGGHGTTDGYYISSSVTIGNTPAKVIGYYETAHEEMYMVIRGESKWLKEFYDVQLIVLNKDGSGESLTDCTATLNSPAGLTLVNCERSQHFDKLESGSPYMIHWYLRGDEAGDYDLTASLSGWSNGEEYTYNFKSKNTLHVYAGNALKMRITIPQYSFYDEDYPVRISFINVSDKPIYNIEHTIFGFTQSSKLTISRYRNGVCVSTEEHFENLQSVSLNKKCSIDVLDPGEEIVAYITIHDIWKSVLEKQILDQKIAADLVTLVSGLSKDPTCLVINFASTLYKSILDSIVVAHVVQCVDVATLEGSTTTVPHEVVVTDISPELAEKYKFSLVQNLAKDLTGWALDQTELDVVQAVYDGGVFFEGVNGAENPGDLISPSAQYALSFMPDGFDWTSDAYTLGEDIYYRVRTPEGGGNVEFSVEESNELVKPAPAANVKRMMSDSDFDIEVIKGDYTIGENGKLIFKSEGIVKLTPRKAGVTANVRAVAENGEETRVPIRIVDEHECEGDFFILCMPGEDRGAIRASFCSTCHKLLDCKQLSQNVVAMFSNGECYDDIRGAVADASSYGEGIKLYIFGELNIVEDVTIPKDLTLVITPDTVITVKDGCKLMAKGKVEDYSGKNYDLSGNGPVIAVTTTATETTTTTETTSTTSDSTTTTTAAVTTTTTAASETTTTENGTSTMPDTGYPVSFGMIAGLAALMTAAGAALVIRSRKEEE